MHKFLSRNDGGDHGAGNTGDPVEIVVGEEV